MAMLNYDAEIRKPEEIKREFTPARTESRKLKLAEQLVDEWQPGKFDFSKYRDHYREKVKQAIEAKIKGEEIQVPEEEPHEVINLMDALKKSVARAGGEAKSSRSHAKSAGKSKRHQRRRRA